MNEEIKIKTLSWFDPEGAQGSQKGFSVDFTKEKIVTWNNKTLPFKSHIDDVLWVIENNLKSLKERKEKISNKFLVNETTIVPIKSGYKIIEPLTDNQKIFFKDKIKTIESEIVEITSLKKFYKNGR